MDVRELGVELGERAAQATALDAVGVGRPLSSPQDGEDARELIGAPPQADAAEVLADARGGRQFRHA